MLLWPQGCRTISGGHSKQMQQVSSSSSSWSLLLASAIGIPNSGTFGWADPADLAWAGGLTVALGGTGLWLRPCTATKLEEPGANFSSYLCIHIALRGRSDQKQDSAFAFPFPVSSIEAIEPFYPLSKGRQGFWSLWGRTREVPHAQVSMILAVGSTQHELMNLHPLGEDVNPFSVGTLLQLRAGIYKSRSLLHRCETQILVKWLRKWWVLLPLTGAGGPNQPGPLVCMCVGLREPLRGSGAVYLEGLEDGWGATPAGLAVPMEGLRLGTPPKGSMSATLVLCHCCSNWPEAMNGAFRA